MAATEKRATRLILAAGSGALVLAGALAALWFAVLSPKMDENVAVTLGRGDYALTATDGTAFTEATLRGAPSAVFFGFTHCPEVCPTTMGDIAMWREELGEAGAALRVYFVTVDPERDTLDMLADYVSWQPGVLGVTGTREEIDKAIRSFRVYAAKVPLDDGDYTMDHSAFVMLFDRDGRFAQPIRYQEEYQSAVTKLRSLLAG